MSRYRSPLGLVLIAAAVAPGCASSPWSSRPQTQPAPAQAAAPAAAARGAIDAQAVQQVLAELRQAGNLDPQTQQKFIDDLQQADPTLWPLMVQQFRAQMAYRQRMSQQGAPAAGTASPPTEQAAATPAPLPGPEPRPQAAATAVASTPAPASPVVKASHEEPVGDQWQKHLAAAIRTREAELQAAGKAADDPVAQAQLRMMYLLAGRREDAMKPIPTASPSVQGFWASEIYGLSTWLDSQRTPDENRRAADAKQHLSEAVSHLADGCPLVVRSLTFCTEIQSYGCLKPFERFEFLPAQAVLLYAEVENLSGEPTPKGIHTSLQSSYQIFDSRGQRVADEEFTVTEEYCRNPRRDYFIGYELRIPERVYPGKHTLQLTIRDTRSQKIGQSTIDFIVKKK